MEKYASVYFDFDELDTYRQFLRAMNGIHIIEISKEEIEESIRYLQLAHIGADNKLVLHGEEEVSSFENIMKAFFPDKEYKITDDPDDEDFSRWLKEKEKNIFTSID